MTFTERVWVRPLAHTRARVEVLALTGVLALGLLLDMRALDASATPDEGVYLASLRELHRRPLRLVT